MLQKIFSGTANLPLSEAVAKALRVNLGKINISKFADNEVGCQIMENVRGCDCFLIQPNSPPVNDNSTLLFFVLYFVALFYCVYFGAVYCVCCLVVVFVCVIFFVSFVFTHTFFNSRCV